MRRAVIVAVLFAAPLLHVGAQYALDVSTLIGFSGVFRAGTWTPVHVTVTNLGQPVRGDLELGIDRGDRFGPNRYTVRYSQHVELVTGSSKAFAFVVPLDTTVYPLTVRFTDGERVAHEERNELLGRSVPARLALVLSRRPNLDFLLPLYNSSEGRTLDLVYPLLSHLPERWEGYEAVDLMVIHDARIHELSAAQVGAIRGWIASGGRLVVSGGSHFGPAAARALEPFGDFSVAGTLTTRVRDAGFPEAGLPTDPGERDALVVATRFADHGSRITRFPIGLGDVVLLPFDYANLVRVAPRTSVGLWNALLATRATDDLIPTEVRRRVFETEGFANQLTLPIYDFPPRVLVLGLAISYTVGLGSIVVWLSRGRDRLRSRLGAPAIVAIVAAVTFTAHQALTVSMQPAEALALTIERAELVDGGGYAMVTRETALFSRQLADYELSYRGSPLLIPMQERDHSVRHGIDGVIQRVTVARWGYANNMAVQIVPFDLRTTVHSGPEYVEIALRNNTSRRISDLVLLRNGYPQSFGDLGPGEVVERVWSDRPDHDERAIEWKEYVADDALAENRARLLGDIARARRMAGLSSNDESPDLVVLGWTDRPLMPVAVHPSFDRTVDLHLVVVPVTLPGGRR